MFPVISDLAGNAGVTHGVFVALGLAVGFWIFYRTVTQANAWDDRFIYMIVGIAVGGALGERLGSVVQIASSQGVDSITSAWLYGGRSILGGLAGAYVGALIGKRISGYSTPTGDYFAPAIAVGLAIGRIGCFLTEAPGRASTLPWAISVPPTSVPLLPQCPACVAGQSMHPSFIYEIVFLLIAYFALERYGERIEAPGERLVLFLAAYSVFRFGVEFTRSNPPAVAGLSSSQIFLLSVSPLFIWKVVRQARLGTYARLLNRRPN